MKTIWVLICGIVLTATTLFAQPATVITITDDDQVVASTILQTGIIGSQTLPADAIVEGDWTGTNDIQFKVLNQTTIDTFSITFRNVGGCSKVTVKTYPVTISGGSFTVSYNIPTISSGSVNGTFAADGRSCSGTFNYSNTQCGGSTSGSWSALPVNIPPATLEPPTNLSASLSGNIVTLNWHAPAVSTSGSVFLQPFPGPIILQSTVRRQPVSMNQKLAAIPSSAIFNLTEIEPNNDFDQAQMVSGPSPAVVNGNAEISDQGALTIEFDDGSKDDVEDLFAVTTQSPGLNLTLSGASSDLDIYLMKVTGTTIEILDASLNAGVVDENIDQSTLAAGSYFIGVSIYDPDPGGPNSSPYQLTVTGDLGGGSTADLQHYNIYRSANPDPKTSGALIGAADASSTTYADDISPISYARLYYQVTAVYESGESEPSNEAYVDLGAQFVKDVGITAIQVPETIALGDTVTVVVVVKNFGTSMQSGFPVSYRINNEPVVSETFNENLPAGETAMKAFSTLWIPAAEGTYNITAWTALAGDQNPTNDVGPTLSAVVQSSDRTIVFTEDFETYPPGSLIGATECPWVQLSSGRNCNVSPYWVHGGAQNFQINSFMYNTEIDYVKFDLTYKPAMLSVSLWYTPDGYYVYEDFAEFGLSFVHSKFEMDAIAGFKGSSHDLWYQADGMSEAVNAFNELEFGRGPASMGQGTPKHNFLRAEFDFNNNVVRLYAGMNNNPSLRSTLPFDGTLDCNALYLAGGLNETYIDDITIEAIGVAVGVDESDLTGFSENYSLAQNYPNPFNPTTTIEFALPRACEVTLKIYNILGAEVATLVSETLPAGNHKRLWEAEDLSSGVYFYRLQTGDYVTTRKLILVR